MKKYKVNVSFIYHYETWVEAESEDAAHDMAMDEAICNMRLSSDWDSVETTTIFTGEE